MQFGHEQLDVYRFAIDYVAWSYAVAKELNGVDRHARDQLLRAAQAIALNIAESVPDIPRKRCIHAARRPR